MRTDAEVQTCAESLLGQGTCCIADCATDATTAALDNDLTEHCVCDVHTERPGWIGTKPLRWSEAWKP